MQEQLIKRLYSNSFEAVMKALKREKKGRKQASKPADWYKRMQLYVTYPDAFIEDGKADLNTLANKLPYMQEMGINALHILPFFRSPMIDMGFDVSDYLSVREDLGGDKAFGSLLQKADQLDITIFADIILNHVSTEHEWFQKAISGDEKYRDYFIWSKEKPNFIKRYKDERGVWAVYDINGEEKEIFIIFPEQAGDIPHWYQAKDGYWYYHSFYPHQIDTNWQNHEIFIEYAKILSYWAEKGVSFRLDAIPYIGKDILNGVIDDPQRTHDIVTALNDVVKESNPQAVFLAEACVRPEELKKYFQTDDICESECAYNFDMCRALWLAIMTGKTGMIWDVLEIATTDVPDFACWVNFVRNHDELSLERMDSDFRERLYELMQDKGLLFREGFGLSGRTASFLDGDPKRVSLIYLLLAALPGVPAIIYGDEIGKENDLDYMNQRREEKVKISGDPDIAVDTRECNRGQIKPEDITTENAQYIYQTISKIFTTRAELKDVFTTKPEKVDLGEGIFAAEYQLDGKTLKVIVNLTNEEVSIENETFSEIRLTVNKAELEGDTLKLGGYSGCFVMA